MVDIDNEKEDRLRLFRKVVDPFLKKLNDLNDKQISFYKYLKKKKETEKIEKIKEQLKK